MEHFDHMVDKSYTVSNPTRGDIHVDTPLTNFSMAWMQSSDMFVALRAVPNLQTSHRSNKYYVFDKATFYRDAAQKRVGGTESAGGGFKVSTHPYWAEVWGYHMDVSDQDAEDQDEQLALEDTNAEIVSQVMMIRRERIFQDECFKPGIWFNGGKVASQGENVDWSAAGSDPIADIKRAKTGIQKASGYRANIGICDRMAMDTLETNEDIVGRINGGSNNANPADVTKELITALFGLNMIFVMDGVYNTGGDGDDVDLEFIGGNHFLVCYAPPMVTRRTPTAFVQFSWNKFVGMTEMGSRIKRFYMTKEESTRVEGQMAFEIKRTASEMGHLFTSVSTA